MSAIAKASDIVAARTRMLFLALTFTMTKGRGVPSLRSERFARVAIDRASMLRFDDLLPAILVSQPQRAGRAFRLQYHVGVFRVRGAGEAHSRGLLRSADLDRRTPALGDQPQQHGLGVRLAVRLRACRQHVEGGPHPAPLIDNFERTASQHRRDASGDRRAYLREREKQK